MQYKPPARVLLALSPMLNDLARQEFSRHLDIDIAGEVNGLGSVPIAVEELRPDFVLAIASIHDEEAELRSDTWQTRPKVRLLTLREGGAFVSIHEFREVELSVADPSFEEIAETILRLANTPPLAPLSPRRPIEPEDGR